MILADKASNVMPTNQPADEIDWTEIRRAQDQYPIRTLPIAGVFFFTFFGSLYVLVTFASWLGLPPNWSFPFAGVLLIPILFPIGRYYPLAERRLIPEAFTVCCPVCGVTWIKELNNNAKSTFGCFFVDEFSMSRQLFWFNCRNCKIPMFAKRVPNWLRERWKETKPDLSRSRLPGIAVANDAVSHNGDPSH